MSNQVRYVTPYDTVRDLVDIINSNNGITSILLSSLSSGVIESGVGTVTTTSGTQLVNNVTLLNGDDSKSVVVDGWTIFFSDIKKFITLNSFTINLISETSVYGIKYIYLSSDLRVVISSAELNGYNSSLVRLLRTEVTESDLVSVVIYPNLISTPKLVRSITPTFTVKSCKIVSSSTKSIDKVNTVIISEGLNCLGSDSTDFNSYRFLPNSTKLVYLDSEGKYTNKLGVSEVDTDYYLVDGIKTLLDEGTYSVQRVSLSIDGTLYLQYSESKFYSLQEAINSSISTEFSSIDDKLSVEVARLVYKKGTTSTSNTDEFIILDSNELKELDKKLSSGLYWYEL